VTGRHATGPWLRVTTAAALEQLLDVVRALPDAIVDWAQALAPEPPAAEPATAIAGRFPLVAGPIDAPYRRGGVDRAAAGLIPAAAPIDRINLERALAEFRLDVAQGLVSHQVTARSHINAGS
jgi:hypothetical protein